jgi:hypothetical protein
MNFTLAFPNSESTELCVAMMFIPCAAWVEGGRTLIVPNRKTPHYEIGYLRVLLELPSIASRLSPNQKMLALIMHPVGHGSSEDLANLLRDCDGEGYSTQVVNFCSQA